MNAVQLDLRKGAYYYTILVPVVALFRVAKQGPQPDGSDLIATLLLATGTLGMLVPNQARL